MACTGTTQTAYLSHKPNFPILCFVDLHTCIISQINPTRCTILFNIFIYFSSLHVSGIHVPIIRRKWLYLCDTGICRSVWVASVLRQQTRRHPYRVTNTSVVQIQQFSHHDGHMDARNM